MCPSHILLGVVCCCIYSSDTPSDGMAVYLLTLWRFMGVRGEIILTYSGEDRLHANKDGKTNG